MIDPWALYGAVLGVLILAVGFDLAIAFLIRTQKEASGRDSTD